MKLPICLAILLICVLAVDSGSLRKCRVIMRKNMKMCINKRKEVSQLPASTTPRQRIHVACKVMTEIVGCLQKTQKSAMVCTNRPKPLPQMSALVRKYEQMKSSFHCD